MKAEVLIDRPTTCDYSHKVTWINVSATDVDSTHAVNVCPTSVSTYGIDPHTKIGPSNCKFSTNIVIDPITAKYKLPNASATKFLGPWGQMKVKGSRFPFKTNCYNCENIKER